MSARALPKWAVAFARDGRESHGQKKEGRHFPLGSPPAPQNSTGSGADVGRLAAITMVGGGYSQQKNYSLCKRERAPAPPGAPDNEDTRAALRLPNLSAFLASSRNVGRSARGAPSGSRPRCRFAKAVWRDCSLHQRTSATRAKKKSCPRWGQPSGRFAASSLVPLRVGVRCGCQQSAVRTIQSDAARSHHLWVAMDRSLQT
jgi:hypothetical protein